MGSERDASRGQLHAHVRFYTVDHRLRVPQSTQEAQYVHSLLTSEERGMNHTVISLMWKGEKEPRNGGDIIDSVGQETSVCFQWIRPRPVSNTQMEAREVCVRTYDSTVVL